MHSQKKTRCVLIAMMTTKFMTALMTCNFNRAKLKNKCFTITIFCCFLSNSGISIWIYKSSSLCHSFFISYFYKSYTFADFTCIFRNVFLFLYIHRYKCIRTVLSSPRVIIITKKMMAKKVDPTMFAMASGYVMKSRLGPRGGAESQKTTLS